jgi:RP/EB family microtubule-associated protein
MYTYPYQMEALTILFLRRVSATSATSVIAVAGSSLSAVPHSISRASSFVCLDHDKVITELNRQVTDLRLAADTLERERNFYYLKLRDLEVVVLERMEKV